MWTADHSNDLVVTNQDVNEGGAKEQTGNIKREIFAEGISKWIALNSQI